MLFGLSYLALTCLLFSCLVSAGRGFCWAVSIVHLYRQIDRPCLPGLDLYFACASMYNPCYEVPCCVPAEALLQASAGAAFCQGGVETGRQACSGTQCLPLTPRTLTL